MAKRKKQDSNRPTLYAMYEGATVPIDGGVHVVGMEPGGSPGTIIVVAVRDYRKRRALDVRSYYLGSPEPEYHPSGKGVWIPAESAVAILGELDSEWERERLVQLLKEEPPPVEKGG